MHLLTFQQYTYQLNEQIAKKGDALIDSKTQAEYKVTKAGRSGATVTYQKSLPGMKTSVSIPSSVKVDNITYKVTGIVSNAFKGSSMLKKATIGKNVTFIGTNAFKGIHKKVTIKIPKRKFSAYNNILRKKGIGTGATYKKLP